MPNLPEPAARTCALGTGGKSTGARSCLRAGICPVSNITVMEAAGMQVITGCFTNVNLPALRCEASSVRQQPSSDLRWWLFFRL